MIIVKAYNAYKNSVLKFLVKNPEKIKWWYKMGNSYQKAISVKKVKRNEKRVKENEMDYYN